MIGPSAMSQMLEPLLSEGFLKLGTKPIDVFADYQLRCAKFPVDVT